MAFLDELRTRYKAKQKDWEKYKEQVRDTKEKEARAREELSALQVLMSSEQGKGAKAKEQPAPLPLELPLSDQNKAQVVHQIVHEHGVQGLVPSQIRKLLEDRKIAMPTNYLYSILLRAKKRGSLTETAGRYYPPDQNAKAAS